MSDIFTKDDVKNLLGSLVGIGNQLQQAVALTLAQEVRSSADRANFFDRCASLQNVYNDRHEELVAIRRIDPKKLNEEDARRRSEQLSIALTYSDSTWAELQGHLESDPLLAGIWVASESKQYRRG